MTTCSSLSRKYPRADQDRDAKQLIGAMTGQPGCVAPWWFHHIND